MWISVGAERIAVGAIGIGRCDCDHGQFELACTFVLGPNGSARIHANRLYNFNRIEMLAGSAVLLSGSNSGLVACGTVGRFSSEGTTDLTSLTPSGSMAR